MKLLIRIGTSISLIVLVAFLLRMAWFWSAQSHALVPITTNPAFGYETGRIARSIAEGRGFSSPLSVESGPTAWLTPIYPYLLAGVFKIFGTYTFLSWLIAATLNMLFSALTCYPIFYVGKRLGGLGVGFLSAWLWVFFPPAFYIPAEWVWDTSLSALMAALILWATLAIPESQRARNWIGYGLLWGMGLMINAAILSLAPFLFLWMALKLRRQGRRWIQLPALATLAMCLVCVPWTVRNYVVFQKLIPLRSNFGLELWLGNNDQVPDTWAGFLHPNDYEPERIKYVRMGEIAYMKEKQHEAFQFMLAHPTDELRFFWRRFADNWIGTWDPLQDIWHTLAIRGKLIIGSYVFLAMFGLVGILLLSRTKNPYTFPIAMFPLIFPIIYYVTHSSVRYRHPIDPAMIVLTAYALAYPFTFRAIARRALGRLTQ